MACRPTGGEPIQTLHSLEHWNSTAFKQDAGAWWADVGHRAPSGDHTNDLEEPNNYPSALPVDSWIVRYERDVPIPVVPDIGGPSISWWVEESGATAQAASTSFESNTTISAGATVGALAVDAGFTFGYGAQETREVSWEETLSFGGGVDMPMDITRQCYRICLLYTSPSPRDRS